MVVFLCPDFGVQIFYYRFKHRLLNAGILLVYRHYTIDLKPGCMLTRKVADEGGGGDCADVYTPKCLWVFWSIPNEPVLI